MRRGDWVVRPESGGGGRGGERCGREKKAELGKKKLEGSDFVFFSKRKNCINLVGGLIFYRSR